MAMSIGHVHIKTYDPKKTAQFYIDNFGATLKNDKRAIFTAAPHAPRATDYLRRLSFSAIPTILDRIKPSFPDDPSTTPSSRSAPSAHRRGLR